MRIVFFLLMGLFLAPDSHAGKEIKVLTYNVWALKPQVPLVTEKLRLSHDTNHRIRLICEELKKNPSWDVVTLQEVWQSKYREVLKNCGYEYHLDKDETQRSVNLNLGGGFLNVLSQALSQALQVDFDSGLLILSHYPISNGDRKVYDGIPVQNISEVASGEIFSAKSALIGSIDFPLEEGSTQKVWIANTHVVSSYFEHKYSQERMQQLETFVKWSQSKSGNYPLILAGDFNEDHINKSPEFIEFSQNHLNQFVRFEGGNDQPTSTSANAWVNDQGAGLIDMIYGSSHLKPTRGGICFDSQTYPRKTDSSQVRHYSDHFGFETTFSIEATSAPETSQESVPVPVASESAKSNSQLDQARKDVEHFVNHNVPNALNKAAADIQHFTNNNVPNAVGQAEKAVNDAGKSVAEAAPVVAAQVTQGVEQLAGHISKIFKF